MPFYVWRQERSHQQDSPKNDQSHCLARYVNHTLVSYAVEHTDFLKKDDLFKGQIAQVFGTYYLVDIGLDCLGILPRKKQKSPSPLTPKAILKFTPNFTQGESGVFQIHKLPTMLKHENKGPVLTTKITLASRLHIYFPTEASFIERSACEKATTKATPSEKTRSQEELKALWEKIMASPIKKGVIYRAPSLLEKAVRDSDERVICEDGALQTQIISFCKKYHKSQENVQVAPPTERPLAQFLGIEEILDGLRSEIIVLSNGATLLQFETPLGLFFDVNTGAEDPHQSNRVAAQKIVEIIQVLRIRGNILIDFVNSAKQHAKSRQAIIDILAPLTPSVMQWSHLGWLEMRV